jgi:hypothetical protein
VRPWRSAWYGQHRRTSTVIASSGIAYAVLSGAGFQCRVLCRGRVPVYS